jgi:hypothetical protein
MQCDDRRSKLGIIRIESQGKHDQVRKCILKIRGYIAGQQ